MRRGCPGFRVGLACFQSCNHLTTGRILARTVRSQALPELAQKALNEVGVGMVQQMLQLGSKLAVKRI